MAAFDVVERECPRSLQRRALKKRQISPLPRYKIEGSMKSVDMTFLNRNKIYRHCNHSGPGTSIPPLAEWLQNTYLGFNSPTTEALP